MRLTLGLRRNAGPLIAAAFGVVIALAGFGPAYIFGTSPFWSYPPLDFSSHLVGWREYVEDVWAYPLLVSRKLDAPVGLSIAYMDALPLAALVVKALRGIVPGFLHTQLLNPFGWWQLVSYALQGTFAALLARSLKGHGVAQVAAALVAMTMQIFIARFVHTALSSHFVILAALWLYVRSDEPSRSIGGAILSASRWSALLAAALLIHPYLFVMAIALFAAAMVRLIAQRRAGLLVTTVVAAGSLVLFVMVLGGYFSSARLAQSSDWGFGHKSTDLLSFFIPQHSPFISTRAHAMALDLAHDEAAEGCDYLGAGLLAIALLVAVGAPRSIGRAVRRNKALALVLFGMTLFAISNRVSFGREVIFEVSVPAAFSWLVGHLRASGRFIWPPTYAAAVWLIVAAFRHYRAGWLALAPPALVLLQVIDGLGNFSFVRSYTKSPERTFLDWTAFDPVISAATRVAVHPSFSCVRPGHGRIVAMQMELETMASLHGIPIANVRSSRPLADCAKEGAADRAGLLPGEGLHVVLAPDVPVAEVERFEQRGASCFTFHAEGAPAGFVCDTRRREMPPGFEPAATALSYVLGTPIHAGSEDSTRYLGEGWAAAEGSHRWTEGRRVVLHVYTDRPVPVGTTLRIVGTALVAPARPRATLTFRINDAEAGAVTVSTPARTSFEVKLPPSAIGKRAIDIAFTLEDVRSPKDLGLNEDTRPLGISVIELALIPRITQ